MGEEGVGFKMDKVGGRGVRHNAGDRRGGGVWPFRSLMAMNGRGRGDDVSMTSSFYLFDLLLF